MMQAKNIYQHIDKKYKFNNQEIWDQCGFTENSTQPIEKVLLCLDLTEQDVSNAIKNKISLIISHHPIFIDSAFPLQKFNQKILSKLKKNKISTIFLHTAFDRSPHGMNILLANQLGLQNVKLSQSQNYAYGIFKNSISIAELAILIKKVFKIDYVKYEQVQSHCKISKIGICGGSGSDAIYEPLNGSLDAFITSDIKHHAWMDAHSIGIKLLDINHTIENIFIDVIADDLHIFNKEITIFKSYNMTKYTII